jgi:septum site-determining protein MinD
VRDTEKTKSLAEQVGGTIGGAIFTMSGTGKSPNVDRIAEFLSVDLLGHVPEDDAVPASQDLGVPVVKYDRESPAAGAYRAVAKRLLDAPERSAQTAEAASRAKRTAATGERRADRSEFEFVSDGRPNSPKPPKPRRRAATRESASPPRSSTTVETEAASETAAGAERSAAPSGDDAPRRSNNARGARTAKPTPAQTSTPEPSAASTDGGTSATGRTTANPPAPEPNEPVVGRTFESLVSEHRTAGTRPTEAPASASSASEPSATASGETANGESTGEAPSGESTDEEVGSESNEIPSDPTDAPPTYRLHISQAADLGWEDDVWGDDAERWFSDEESADPAENPLAEEAERTVRLRNQESRRMGPDSLGARLKTAPSRAVGREQK